MPPARSVVSGWLPGNGPRRGHVGHSRGPCGGRRRKEGPPLDAPTEQMYDNGPPMTLLTRLASGNLIDKKPHHPACQRPSLRAATRLIKYVQTQQAVIPPISYPHVSRDPIHHFIGFTSEERKVLDSRPVQRLRQIHQLAMTSLVYPGASHARFEHSLGVMHMATQIYDVITDPEHIREEIRNLLPEIHDTQKLMHWRGILRMAALCHDIGHLPFSHAAEELLPNGWTHERLSYALIMSDDMKPVWDGLDPYMKPELIAKLALGLEEVHEFAPEVAFTTWETVLSEIIVGTFFGADRMDYLLRDSYHAGVAYGQFDHFRLIDTLRILPPSPEQVAADEKSLEPALGVQYGGLQSAQAMMLARFFMFSQVYYHSARLIYDIHLLDFLKDWLPDGKYPTDLQHHLQLTDSEVTVALQNANRDANAKGHAAAKAILERGHYRVFYEPAPKDNQYDRPGDQVYEAACKQFGKDKVRYTRQVNKVADVDYPVVMRDNEVVSSVNVVQLRPQEYEYTFISPELRTEAREWLKKNRDTVITKKKGEP